MYCCYSGQISGDDPIDVGGVIGSNQEGKVTACYWSGYDGVGIGYGESGTEVTKVDGVSVSWPDAVAALNAAMAGTDYEKSYKWEIYEGKPEIASKKSSSLTPAD